MTTELRQTVLNLLRENIHPDRNEANESRQHLPEEAIANATPDSLQAFFEILSAISNLLPSDDHYRTRFVEHSSTNGVGILYYTRPMGDGPQARGIQIQSILLPTKNKYVGCIEAYLRGHEHSPITAPLRCNEPVGNELIDGRPVFRIIGRPSRQLTQQVVNSFSRSSLFSQIQSD